MAPAASTASPTPGPSGSTQKGSTQKDVRATAVALYNWCRVNYDEDHILSQKDLLEGDIIPRKDPQILLHVTQSLIDQRLFRTHDLRSGGIGWKIVSHVSAEKYKDLSSDESLVYSVIESAGRAGAWVKTIRSKLNLHQKNVDQSIKTLIQRGHIKPMSTVKSLNRKMYILAGLQPSEDATGGAWFTDGVLDHELLDILATTLERKISELSWKPLPDLEDGAVGVEFGSSRKRKEPHGGFDSTGKGKEKMRRKVTNDVNEAKRAEKVYVPYSAGYQNYPTLRSLTDFVNENNILQSGKIPENNISQLLDVMVYDDKIIKIKPPPDSSAPTVYKARKNLGQLKADGALSSQARRPALDEAARMKALRELEIKALGDGGITEVPCGRCPVFDMCEVGGPVNPTNCEYFDEWFIKLEGMGSNLEDGLTW